MVGLNFSLCTFESPAFLSLVPDIAVARRDSMSTTADLFWYPVMLSPKCPINMKLFLSHCAILKTGTSPAGAVPPPQEQTHQLYCRDY